MIPLAQKAHSLWLLVLFALIAFLTGMYMGAGVDARIYEWITTLLLGYGTIWWLRVDSQKRNFPSEMTGLFDKLWFLIWGFPFIIPYHLISTRKWRGALCVLLALVLVILAAAFGTSIGSRILAAP